MSASVLLSPQAESKPSILPMRDAGINIASLLQFQVEERPTAPAIIETVRRRDRITSFSALQQRVTQAAALLRQAGLQPGDEVLVFQPMSTELYVALIALFRLGMVAMFVDPSAGLGHIEQCCALIPPKAFIGNRKAHLLRLLSPALRRIPRNFVIGAHLPGAISWSGATQLEPYQEIYPVGSDTPALLTFTSGSTGQPKAALRTHGFLLAQHRVLAQHFGGQAGEVSLNTMPIFVLADLASGVTSLIAAGNLRKPGKIAAGPVIKQIERYRPSRAGASPAFWERITAYCQRSNKQLPQLTFIYTGGAPVFPRLLDDLQRVAPQAELAAIYGSTEVEPIARMMRGEMGPEDIAAMLQGKGLLAGIPTPQLQLRILREQWGKALMPYSAAAFDADCLPAGIPGEIVVSGRHVLPGYVQGHGDEETKFRVDGKIWHRTGDMGYLDGSGRLWLLGRCAARITDRRGTLYPFTVECAVSSYPAVRRAAAATLHGQRVLVLELDDHFPAPNLEAIRQTVMWAGLDAIHACDRLPVDKRHNAKIDYPALYRVLEAWAAKKGNRQPGVRAFSTRESASRWSFRDRR
jgi:acyl-CoA synthetase (AMP-forming)/AMP-acid ligase II